MKHIIAIISAIALVGACGIYSFTGTSIQPDVKTITIPYIENKAIRVNPSLSNDITEALQDKFSKLTSLTRWSRTEIWSWCARLQAMT